MTRFEPGIPEPGTPEPRTAVGFGISLVQQLRLLAWSGRWLFLFLGLLVLLVIAGTTDIASGLGLPPVLVAAMLGLPAPAIWAVAVWHGELPHRRSYHWSLPVSRAAHDLARVAAGAAWLLAVYLALAACGAVLAATNGAWPGFAAIGWAWITFFAGPLVLYLLISPFVLWSDSPWLRRGVTAFIALGFLATVLDVAVFGDVLQAVFGPGWGLSDALFVLQAEGGTTALWLVIGLVATAAAATWRPEEIARAARARATGT